MLVWMICIAEPFVTKPSMVRHHYKPVSYVKNGFLSSRSRSQKLNFSSYNQIWLFLLYVLNCWFFFVIFFFGDQLVNSFLCVLYSRSRAQWRFWTSMNVCPDNISGRSSLVWWYTIISQSIIQKYHFAMSKVKARIISTRSSEILKLLQPKLVWWYIITRLFCFHTGKWFGWTRLLPLLAIPISKAGVNTGSNQENVERTLLL